MIDDAEAGASTYLKVGEEVDGLGQRDETVFVQHQLLQLATPETTDKHNLNTWWQNAKLRLRLREGQWWRFSNAPQAPPGARPHPLASQVQPMKGKSLLACRVPLG